MNVIFHMDYMDLNKLDHDQEQGLIHRSNGESGPFF